MLLSFSLLSTFELKVCSNSTIQVSWYGLLNKGFYLSSQPWKIRDKISKSTGRIFFPWAMYTTQVFGKPCFFAICCPLNNKISNHVPYLVSKLLVRLHHFLLGFGEIRA